MLSRSVAVLPCHLGWRTLLKCNKTNHACLPGAFERYNPMRAVFCHAHLEEGQPAVKLILVELEIKHCDDGATVPDSLDDLFANDEASIHSSHEGIRGVHCLAFGRTRNCREDAPPFFDIVAINVQTDELRGSSLQHGRGAKVGSNL
jgi:hypothetical protein